MRFYSQARRYASLFSSLSLTLVSAPSFADMSTTPVIGGVFSSSDVLKNQVLSSLDYSAKLTRDAALFTIGGVTLDAYILALPLDAKTKARVIAQLSNPTYSIPLGYFLYSYYDRYSGLGSEDVFKGYLSTVYDNEALKGFEHSLYYVGDEPVSEHKEPDTSTEATGHHEGIRIDEQFIANMVVIYDALFEIGVWQDMDTLPESYTYLTNSPEDLAIIAQIQPIIVDLIGKATLGMDDGDMKSAMLAIAEDGKPENADKPNNKAQALTVTLIDFVRLNLLKAYRQFVFKEERAEALDDWMQQAFSDQPDVLIQFLESQQNKRFAVQVTVDGLQQGLIRRLGR